MFTEKRRKIALGRKGKLIAGVILLASLVFAWHFTHSKPQQAALRPGMMPAVQTITLKRADLLKTVRLSGRTVAEAQVDIAAKYSGKIAQVLVKLGDRVEVGQVLLVQDTADLAAALVRDEAALRGADADAVESDAAFQASYHKAQADYSRALTNAERYRSLHAMGAVSKEALDKVEETLTAAKADLDIWSKQLVGDNAASVVSKQAATEKAAAAVAVLRQQLADMTLRAPRSGVIGFRQAEPGNMAQAGQTLLSIVDNSKIYVDCTVAETDIGQVPLGMSADVAVDALGKTYKAKVIYVSPSLDSATQSFTVRLELDAADQDLKAGLFARTSLTALLRKDALFVPKTAISSLNGKDRIFILDSNSQVRERPVKTGFRSDDSVELLDGVQEGEKVVVTNIARLRNGLTVTEAAP